MTARIPCRAVFLDAGGVIVLPDRHLLADALARAGILIDPATVPRAHYRAVRALDRALGQTANPAVGHTVHRTVGQTSDHATAPAGNSCAGDPCAGDPCAGNPRAGNPCAGNPCAGNPRAGNPRAGNPRAGNPCAGNPCAGNPRAPATRADYPRALLPQLGIVPGQAAEALAVWERLADGSRSGAVLWREPTPGAHRAITSLQRAGLRVVVVTNSDGHGEENLRASGFDLPVIDSTVIGAAKPDPRIFHAALARAGAAPAEAVHVGDTLANDVAGARAAGITPIHFDPLRNCHATDHVHVRTVRGIWRHVRAPS